MVVNSRRILLLCLLIADAVVLLLRQLPACMSDLCVCVCQCVCVLVSVCQSVVPCRVYDSVQKRVILMNHKRCVRRDCYLTVIILA